MAVERKTLIRSSQASQAVGLKHPMLFGVFSRGIPLEFVFAELFHPGRVRIKVHDSTQ